MIYRSNIIAPDLQPFFAATTICKPRHWSMGHDVLSDSEFEPECGFMTHDEAAILHECAARLRGRALDIGARTCWTSAHIARTGLGVIAIDPELSIDGVSNGYMSPLGYRAVDNLKECGISGQVALFGACAKSFFDAIPRDYVASLICIDGNHDAPEPLNDARNALKHIADTGVIVFHDFWGRPIREGVEYLMSQGMRCRVYDTPAGMAVCWRGQFEPPYHAPDPAINWARVRRNRAPEFDFERCV